MRVLLRGTQLNKTLTIVFTITIILLIIGYFAGYRLNHTDSAPNLIWRITEQRDPEIGDYVTVCLPKEFVHDHGIKDIIGLAHGLCGGIPPLLKRVPANLGDTIEINLQGIWVNGALLKNSRPAGKLTGIRAPQKFIQGLPDFVVGGNVSTGYDSRYFGAIKRKWITGIAIPIY